MPTINHEHPQNLVPVANVNWMMLTEQRAAIAAALSEVTTDGVFEALEGVLCLLDYMSDAAEEHGLLSPVDREIWWVAGCQAVGVVVRVDCDHEKLTIKNRQPICRKCHEPVA